MVSFPTTSQSAPSYIQKCLIKVGVSQMLKENLCEDWNRILTVGKLLPVEKNLTPSPHMKQCQVDWHCSCYFAFDGGFHWHVKRFGQWCWFPVSNFFTCLEYFKLCFWRCAVQAMDYTTIKAACTELSSSWVPAKIEKIVQSDRFTLGMAIRTMERSSWLKICWNPTCAHISVGDTLSGNEVSVSDNFSFGEQLRYLLRGLAILEVWQKPNSKRLETKNPKSTKSLCLLMITGFWIFRIYNYACNV